MMQNKTDSQIVDNYEDELYLWDLIQILVSKKWIIGASTTLAATIALVYSLFLPNIYESRVLLVPNDFNNQSNILQNYSGLANLAGVNLPSQDTQSNSSKAIKKLSSFSFFKSNILPNIFLPNLIAIKSWNSDSNKINYKSNIYDVSTNTWVRDYSYPKKLIPSAQESFNVFQEKHISISEDKKNNLVTLRVKHQSPHVAKKWAQLITDEINNFYREKDKYETERAVKYLNSQMANTNFAEIKQGIAALLQQETQKLTLIEVNEFYVYDTIDPAVVMEEKSEPKRAIITILGALLGGFLSAILVILRYFFNSETDPYNKSEI